MEKIAIAAITTMLLIGCTVDYDADLEDMESNIVIIGQVCDTLAHQTVRISHTVPYYSIETKNGISGATAKIETSDGKTFELKEDSTESGLYRTKEAFAGQIGISYTLAVNFDFNNDGETETYQASSTMQSLLQIDSISFNSQKLLGYSIYPLTIYGPEFEDEKYILINYLLNETPVTTQINQWLTFDSKFLSNDSINGISLISTTITNTIVDKKDKDKCSDKENKLPILVESGDTITVLFSQIEEGYYNFIKQCKAASKSENPIWGGNNANITTNLSGGALGYFSTRSFVKKVSIIP